MQTASRQPLEVFCSYAQQDQELYNELEKNLGFLRRRGLITVRRDRDISVGAVSKHEINEQMNRAEIILLLVSPDYLASYYCYREMQRAIERHERGKVCAIHIILKPCAWQVTPLGKLQALPKDGKPVTSWHDRNAAFLDIAKGIEKVVKGILNI